MKTEAQICREALQVQDAPNLAGVLTSFKENLCDLRTHLGGDWDKSNRHPAMYLFAAQVLYLTGGDMVDVNKYSDATAECRRIAEGK